jgi:hypothetical protein
MVIDQMRNEIEKVYPGDSWKRKVALMDENQVIAVYYKFLHDGKFEPEPLPRKPRAHQMTFDEYIREVSE